MRLPSTLLLSFLCLASSRAEVSHGHPNHGALHVARSGHDTAPPSVKDAEEILRNAKKVMQALNEQKLNNPVHNNYQFGPAQAELKKPADPLPYTEDPHTVLSRRAANSVTSGYTIPPALAQAAKIVAESKPQLPRGNHSEVAAQAIAKYHKGSIVTRDVSDEAELKLKERASSSSGYWMVTDQSHPGMSPFAPSGYKVWRNVKDYGAKGDGKTDDTAAINNAISDGGRCGMGCGSSTIYPAVVYFPPGTYLVSSPIIQYYNTQFLGDPMDYPTILAASSFVGLGVMSSDVYTGGDNEWYLNTNNFLRSIKNFKIDIRLTDPTAYVCAIHWQVAQGTSLENIEFYALYNSDVPQNTQQGIYAENGSGGFMANLTFVGGNFGAYFGGQQFTTTQLTFVNCNTAAQVHWDWAWTLQNYVIESCGTGLVVTGGAGDATGGGVGSLVFTDSLIANTPDAIVVTIEPNNGNSTSFLIQNIGFFNVGKAVKGSITGGALLTGGTRTIHSWGIGNINDAQGHKSFLYGHSVPKPNRPAALLGTAYSQMDRNWFTRRRPTYYNVPSSQVMNVKALGAKGDGKTDDTAVLNSILARAASSGSVVFFPFGVYIIKDTLKVPMNSKIVGQAWSQIMATGSKFENANSPRVAVQVGQKGDPAGSMEIQDMLFTVSGATAGAILVEWNARQSSQGSVGMWDSHFRVGGATGSQLQTSQCPKLTGKVNSKCQAASMMMHLTPQSTAYLENVWVWVADHDLDDPQQRQIDIYAARGVLIESSTAWLWGTASEHAVMYQYQLNGASNVLMAMIQTETPYWQPNPPAAHPYSPGKFSGDPSFAKCKTRGCALAWALRIVNSDHVYMLGAGLYSFFYGYDQGCLATESCQQRGVELVNSKDTWLYNLNTKAMIEIVSPANKAPLLADDYADGFMSSMLAYLGSSGS